MSSQESVLIYDAIPKKSSTLKKSNSRVSSTGNLIANLQLRVIIDFTVYFQLLTKPIHSNDFEKA